MSIIAISLVVLWIMLSVRVSLSPKDALKVCGVLCLAHFIVMYLVYAKKEGKLITLYGLFMLSFFMFQCGQYVIYGLNMPYNYFYVEKYELSIVLDSAIFSSMCNSAVFLAYGFIKQNQNIGRISKQVLLRSDESVSTIAFMIFLVLAVVDIPLTLVKFTYALRSGYDGVRAFEDTLPSLLSLIDQMFIPFGVLNVVYAKRKTMVYGTEIVIAIWSILTTLCGDRTSGIAGFLIIGLFAYYGFAKKHEALTKNKKRTFGFLVLCLFLMYLIMFAYKFRTQEGELSFFTGITQIITEVFGELGFSFFPLVLTMRICPTTEAFLYGKSIICSLLAAFIPASLDFTGLWDWLNTLGKESYYWVEDYYNYTFGLGYSLNAEAYSNFGYWGIIWIFIIGLIVCICLKEPNINDSEYKFENYKSLALLFAFFTMPRRSCFYITNFLFYYVFVVGIILILLSKPRKRRLS